MVLSHLRYYPIYGIIPFMVLFPFMVLSHLWYYSIYGIIPFMVLSHLWYFPPYFFCKVNANERNESLLSSCRVQLNFCKVNANERNGKEILLFYLLRYMISIIFISIFRPCSKSFLRLRFHSHQEPAATFAHLSYIKNEAASRLYTPRCLILYISNPG